MSDRASTTDLSADTLTRRLRDLPPATPPADSWATLASSLRAHGLVRDDGDGDASTGSRGGLAHESLRPRDSRRASPARRRWLAAGIAAVLALCTLVLVPANRTERTVAALPTTPTPTPTSPTRTAAADEFTALRNESSRIEEWLRTLKADETPLDGRSLMAATEIEDMIGLIDLQLAAGNDASNDTQALWRERVGLLRDLAAVRTTYSLAGTGIAANGTAAMPDNWTHL